MRTITGFFVVFCPAASAIRLCHLQINWWLVKRHFAYEERLGRVSDVPVRVGAGYGCCFGHEVCKLTSSVVWHSQETCGTLATDLHSMQTVRG